MSFRFSSHLDYRTQAVDLAGACSTEALTFIILFLVGRVLCKISETIKQQRFKFLIPDIAIPTRSSSALGVFSQHYSDHEFVP